MIVRPARITDLAALLTLARQAVPGLATLPANEERLAHRLRWTQRAFAGQIERADAVGEESQRFVDRLFGGRVSPLIAHLADREALTDTDIAEIEALLRKLKS